MQTQTDSSPRGKPALGNAGPCRGAGSLPPCGPSAAPWCPGHLKASLRSGAAVTAATWGQPACRVVRTRTSQADVAFPRRQAPGRVPCVAPHYGCHLQQRRQTPEVTGVGGGGDVQAQAGWRPTCLSQEEARLTFAQTLSREKRKPSVPTPWGLPRGAHGAVPDVCKVQPGCRGRVRGDVVRCRRG